ncbi:MAG TPA: 4-(cytidine 5'-diphospho)-2-C-methyl-D-erythritol kinase [Candidatus Limnocylindria bacterium]|nr:4-(cytidine 5'-diphospho)-2-C-methyl-D-erythritol kinase [Candidatus Limnocylindria bacterium]
MTAATPIEDSVTVRAPAKVNLQLSVGALRPDGLHDLVNVFHAVGLYDDVTARPGRAGPTVTVSGESADQVPTDESNLAVRAALALADAAGVSPDVELHLAKGIPVAGGMAGGSADAAAALVACDALWGTRLERGELHELAEGLGADVPFALLGGTAVGLGTGTHLTPALARGRFAWVFALAEGGLSTPEVYAEYDRQVEGRILPEPRLSDALMTALRAGDAVALGQALTNDLQRPALALRPRLQFTLDVGLEHGALGALVSGSGPTCAFLARDESHALDLAVALSAAGVCRTVRRADGPVHGARILGPGV